MDENDPLSEQNINPLGNNRTNGSVSPKSTSKLRSAQQFRYSIVIQRFIPLANILISILITIITMDFITLLTIITLFIVTIYCA